MFDGVSSEASPVERGLKCINVTPTMTERLHQEREQLRSKLAEVESALSTIESHPEVQQVIDALAKLHWLW